MNSPQQSFLEIAAKVLTASGVFHVSVRYEERAYGEPYYETYYYKTEDFSGGSLKTFKTRRELTVFLEELPTPEQRSKQAFHQSLSDLIKQGTDAGLDEALLSGLVTTHEALTTNLLTYSRKSGGPYDDMLF